jgi:hypothetical protein
MSRKRILLTAALTASAAVLGTTATATAATPRIHVAGLGTSVATSGGADYEGWLSGRPFSGDFTGAVAADDGSLPTVGACEPATATLRVESSKGQSFALFSPGKVCAVYLPLGVMQQFTGRYVVTSATQRGLLRTDGHLDVRLLNGQSDVYAIES